MLRTARTRRALTHTPRPKDIADVQVGGRAGSGNPPFDVVRYDAVDGVFEVRGATLRRGLLTINLRLEAAPTATCAVAVQPSGRSPRAVQLHPLQIDRANYC